MSLYLDWEVAKARAEVKTVIDPIAANDTLYTDRLAMFTEAYRALEKLSLTTPATTVADRRR